MPLRRSAGPCTANLRSHLLMGSHNGGSSAGTQSHAIDMDYEDAPDAPPHERGGGGGAPPPAAPIFFRDSVLVDRDVSIAVVNIVQFHRYVLRHHGTDVTRGHAEVVKLVHAAARRCGGILEHFSGDRFLVSFNATSKCAHHQVAAACFALETTAAANKAAIGAMRRRRGRRGGGGGKSSARERGRSGNKPQRRGTRQGTWR